ERHFHGFALEVVDDGFAHVARADAIVGRIVKPPAGAQHVGQPRLADAGHAEHGDRVARRFDELIGARKPHSRPGTALAVPPTASFPRRRESLFLPGRSGKGDSRLRGNDAVEEYRTAFNASAPPSQAGGNFCRRPGLNCRYVATFRAARAKKTNRFNVTSSWHPICIGYGERV